MKNHLSQLLGNKGIAFRLVLFITCCSTAVFLIVFLTNYYLSREMMKKNVETSARNLLDSTLYRIESALRPVMKIPENIAFVIEHTPFSKAELAEFSRLIVKNNPEIFGATIALVPAADGSLFAPYFYRHGESIRRADYSLPPHTYTGKQWYTLPMKTGKPVWSEPYVAESADNILMVTYSVPFYRKVEGQRQFAGVVTADISLEWLTDIVSSVKFLKTGYGALLSKKGTYVTHPDKNLIMRETIFTMADKVGDPHLKEVGRQMIRGEPGDIRAKTIYGWISWIYYAPIPSNGWIFGIAFPEKEIYEDIDRLSFLVVILCLAGLAALLIALVITARSITRPLTTMTKAVEQISGGNLDALLPLVKSEDEVGKLSRSFSAMQQSLKQYIADLTTTVAAKERIESELSIAREIQMGIIPKAFPAFPQHNEFNVFAMIETAKEVGGDFYDFFFIDEQQLCFVIADVSGKGIPASLFMAVTKTLIKATAHDEKMPDPILTRVNKELSTENTTGMFVTVFCGILNIGTGEVYYANGGHNPPLLIKNNGDVSFLESRGEPVIGAVDDYIYTRGSLILNKGDALFLYTDGVNEAMNKAGELYGTTRMQNKMLALAGSPIETVLKGMMDDISAFSRGAEQSDDITMMMLQFRGNAQ